jgi:hypothetical protein
LTNASSSLFLNDELAHVPLTFLFPAFLFVQDAFSVLLSSFPTPNVPVTIGPPVVAMALSCTLEEIALIHLAIQPQFGALTMPLAVEPLAGVGLPRCVSHTASTMLPVILPFSTVV